MAAVLASLPLCAGLVAGGMALAPAAWAQTLAPALTASDENPLVQRGVPAEATAENAVVARDRALASGQRIAYERMAERLGLPRGLSDAQIEAMVASLIIESERVTPRGYSARITVNFNPNVDPPGGGTLARPMAPATPGLPASPPAGATGPVAATLETEARYLSLRDYLEVRRRLAASAAVARVEVVSFSGEMARLRLGLRSPPPVAAGELAQGGLVLAPSATAATGGAPRDARPGEGWRLDLGWR